MKLLMIRHAKAMDRDEWQKQNKNDDERPLTQEGIDEFVHVATVLPNFIPVLHELYTSPAKRTVQTAYIVQKAYLEVKLTPTDVLKQGTPWKEVQTFFSKQEWNKDNVIAIVGHENHLSNILGNLISSNDDQNIRFKKGGLALIDLGQMEGKVSGKLVWFMPPKIILKFHHPK